MRLVNYLAAAALAFLALAAWAALALAALFDFLAGFTFLALVAFTAGSWVAAAAAACAAAGEETRAKGMANTVALIKAVNNFFIIFLCGGWRVDKHNANFNAFVQGCVDGCLLNSVDRCQLGGYQTHRPVLWPATLLPAWRVQT